MTTEISLPQDSKVVSREGSKAVFEISGLYPGYGVTLGNALRRVLLSSLPGAAPTYVTFANVPHEFTTLPGVKETALQLVLNLKQLRVKVFTDEPQVVRVKKKGPGEVTSDDIEAPSQVEVISKKLLLATLTDKSAEIEMEITVERGVGYVASQMHKKEKIPVGSIALDAVFTPVTVANFTVENMRVGDRTDYNRLILTIETDGTVTPEDALVHAARILVEQFSTLIPEEGRENPVLREPLAVLGISGRTVSLLEDAGVRTVAGLVQKTREQLLDIDGLGEKTVEEVEEQLKEHELSLREAAE